MSTHAMVARLAEDESVVGNYIYHDGYIDGVGKALWEALWSETFNGDIDRLLTVLIDEHTAGWSSIVDADWTKEPGYVAPSKRDFRLRGERRMQPECYCHGDRSETRDLREYGSDIFGNVSWVYVIDVKTRRMDIFRSSRADLFESVDLDGTEPDWRALYEKANAA